MDVPPEVGRSAGGHRAFTVLWLAYPFAVWAGLALSGPRLAAVLVFALLGGRLLLLGGSLEPAARRRLLLPVFAAGLPAVFAAALGSELLLLLAPVGVNLGLLFAFARTLWRGPPLVETLARLSVGALSTAEVRHCRGVTVLWCAFLAANAGLSAWLALRGPLEAWALWTGALGYVAIGVLFAAELTVRSLRFRHYGSGPGEALMRRLLPPR